MNLGNNTKSYVFLFKVTGTDRDTSAGLSTLRVQNVHTHCYTRTHRKGPTDLYDVRN